MKKTTVAVTTIIVVVLLMTTVLLAGCTDSQSAPVPATKENLVEGKATLLPDGSCVIKENDVVQECDAAERNFARHSCQGKCSQ